MCEQVGGYLAEPKTQQQADFLISLAFVEQSMVGVEAWWIGLTDQSHEGRSVFCDLSLYLLLQVGVVTLCL